MIIFVHFYFPFSVHCYIIIYKAKSLYNKILKKINSNEYNNLKFSYNYSNNMVRIILIGDPNEINELIMC